MGPDPKPDETRLVTAQGTFLVSQNLFSPLQIDRVVHKAPEERCQFRGCDIRLDLLHDLDQDLGLRVQTGGLLLRESLGNGGFLCLSKAIRGNLLGPLNDLIHVQVVLVEDLQQFRGQNAQSDIRNGVFSLEVVVLLEDGVHIREIETLAGGGKGGLLSGATRTVMLDHDGLGGSIPNKVEEVPHVLPVGVQEEGKHFGGSLLFHGHVMLLSLWCGCCFRDHRDLLQHQT